MKLLSILGFLVIMLSQAGCFRDKQNEPAIEPASANGHVTDPEPLNPNVPENGPEPSSPFNPKQATSEPTSPTLNSSGSKLPPKGVVRALNGSFKLNNQETVQITLAYTATSRPSRLSAEVVLAPSHGTITPPKCFSGVCTLNYRAQAGYVGADVFHFQIIADGVRSNTGVLNLNVMPAPVAPPPPPPPPAPVDHLIHSNGGYPVDAGEMVSGNIQCLFHSNDDISLLFTSGRNTSWGAGEYRLGLETISRYQHEAKEWSYLTSSGFARLGVAKDVTQGEWRVTHRAFTWDEVGQRFFGLIAPQSHFHGDEDDEHGYYRMVRMSVDGDLEYYNSSRTYQTRVSSFNAMGWNAALSNNRFQIEWDHSQTNALSILSHTNYSAIPSVFSLAAVRLVRATQKWEWFNALTNSWTQTQPAYDSMKLVAGIAGSVRYRRPHVKMKPDGFWITFTSSPPHSSYENIHLIRYSNETSVFERYTPTGWAQSGDLKPLNTHQIINPNDGVPYRVTASPDGALTIFYISTLGTVRSLRAIHVSHDGQTVRESQLPIETFLNAPIQETFQYQASSFEDSIPFVVFTQAPSRRAFALKLKDDTWYAVHGENGLGQMNPSPQIECVKGHNDDQITLVYQSVNRIYSMFSAPRTTGAKNHFFEDPRIQENMPAASSDLFFESELNSTVTTGLGHFSVDSSGAMLFSQAGFNRLFFSPQNMSPVGQREYTSWPQLRFPVSTAFGTSMTPGLSYVLLKNTFESPILRSVNVGTSTLTEYASISVVAGIALSNSSQIVYIENNRESKPVNKIFIADGRNARIAVVGTSGTGLESKGSFGREGKAAGEFLNPAGICHYRHGDQEALFVSDSKKHRIEKFSLDGTYMGVGWGGYGTEKGQFVYPGTVACHGDRVYVLDVGNNRVQIFDGMGNFLHQFNQISTNFELKKINSITTDPLGFLYIAASKSEAFSPQFIFKLRTEGSGITNPD